ncbi:MAG: hypothetical protein V4646_11435 [Pseudomonadota bacterium]
MHIDAHLLKISRLQSSRSRLDPLADFELWFWATMLAGTHALNAALHHAGLTSAHHAFSMQPGVYLVPQSGGELTPMLCAPGDVLHLGRPKIDGELPADVQRMAKAMETIEKYRDPCVREGRAATPEIVSACDEALQECLSVLRLRIPE